MSAKPPAPHQTLQIETMNPIENCPCGSEKTFAQCCSTYLNGSGKAETAEQLMRSRYCAYLQENESYLKNTWHPETRPNSIEFEPAIKWIRLRIKNTEKGSSNDDQGIVEFIATYKNKGKAFHLHEISRFVRSDGEWAYMNGNTQ